MSPLEASNLLGEFKRYHIKKRDLAPCFVCLQPPPMLCVSSNFVARVRLVLMSRRLLCAWRARVMTCQEESVVTVEEAFTHATPAKAARKPVLTEPMKDNVLLERLGWDETAVQRVQRFAHQSVAGRLGGSDLRSAVRQTLLEAGFSGREEETAAFTFTSRTEENGNYETGIGSDADPFVVGISSKKLLRCADRDPESFVFYMDSTYKLTQVGHEDQHTEVFMLLRNVFAAVTSKPLRVKYVMGVADAAQWNAVNSVFGSDCDYTFLICYFHVTKKNLRKRGYVPPARAIEHCFGRSSDLGYIQKQHVSLSADGTFYLRILRVKTSEEQKLTLIPDKNDFLTCPLHTLAGVLATQDAPCVALLNLLPELVTRKSINLDEGAPLHDVLAADPTSLQVGVVPTWTPAIFVETTSASAQRANGDDRPASQWIFDRGAWNMTKTNTAFAYITNAAREDRKVARVLSVSVQCLYWSKATTAHVSTKFLSVLAAYLIRYFPQMKDLAPMAPIITGVEDSLVGVDIPLADMLAWSVALNEKVEDYKDQVLDAGRRAQNATLEFLKSKDTK
ncbi:hypothetical protein F443_00710, partial [Phytophthora nicotianae P1569]